MCIFVPLSNKKKLFYIKNKALFMNSFQKIKIFQLFFLKTYKNLYYCKLQPFITNNIKYKNKLISCKNFKKPGAHTQMYYFKTKKNIYLKLIAVKYGRFSTFFKHFF